MNKFEKLTPKEEKIVLTAYAIQCVNSFKETYTSKDVFNIYNSILVNNGFEKVVYNTFQKYLLTLKKLGIITIYFKRVFKKGTEIYYELLTTIKKCAEVLKGFFKKDKLDKFNERKNSFLSKSSVSNISVLHQSLASVSYINYIKPNINSNNIIIDDNILNIVDSCDFESIKKEEIIKEIENDIVENTNLTMNIKQYKIIKHNEAVNKWLSKSQIKDNPLAVLVSKQQLSKDIRIKMLYQLQSKGLSNSNTNNKTYKSSLISYNKTRINSNIEYKSLPTENELDEAIDALRQDFLKRAEGCYSVTKRLESELADIKAEYMKDLYTVTFLKQKDKFANYARCMDRLKKRIKLVNIEEDKKQKRILLTSSITNGAWNHNTKFNEEIILPYAKVFIEAQGEHLNTEYLFYYVKAFCLLLHEKLQNPSSSLENLKVLPEDCIQFTKDNLNEIKDYVIEKLEKFKNKKYDFVID